MDNNTKESKAKQIFSPYNLVHILCDFIIVVVWIIYFVEEYKSYTQDGYSFPGLFAFIIIGSIVMNIGACFIALFLKKGKLRTGLVITLSFIGFLWFIFAISMFALQDSGATRFELLYSLIVLIIGLLHIVYTILEPHIPNMISNMNKRSKRMDDKEISLKPIANIQPMTRRDEETINKEDKIVEYCLLEVRPKDFEQKVNALATQGWKVISQSESTWTIRKCCGLSTTVDSIINVTLGR